MTTATPSGAMRARRARVAGAGVALALVGGLMYAPAAVANNAPPVTGAAFTTTNTNVDGPGHCKNGNEDVNCNIYDGKEYVWLNGGPSTAYVGNGDYFFAVLEPGGQPDPNDGGAKNLSDLPGGDAYTNRTFSVLDGKISYAGSHDFSGNKIRLMPYDDTTNPGGVYILAICSLDGTNPVNPSRCKYDAFKVRTTEEPPVVVHAPTVTKGATGAYKRKWTWGIEKQAEKTVVKQIGGTATFNYTVSVAHDGGRNKDVTVTGTITAFNPNLHNGAILPVAGVKVSDALSDGTACVVAGGDDVTLSGAETSFSYSCTLSTLPSDALANNVTVTWPTQFLDNGGLLEAGSSKFTFGDIGFDETRIDECVDVTDVFAGGVSEILGRACSSSDFNPQLFPYSRSVPVPAYDCVGYDNTATFLTSTTGATGSAKASVSVCGPARTGGLTMGFWQNKNGQGIVAGQAKTGTCPSAAWLRQYAPFQDLSATATCSATATYVFNTIKAANASGASMNAMLKAQMLATALDVYFSDPALGGNKVGAFNGLGSAQQPIGNVSIDLTKVCKMTTSAGVSTCAGTLRDVSAAFGGDTSLKVSQMLDYAASRSDWGGKMWYGNIKLTQEMAKDAFDGINNQVVFKS